MKRYSTDIGAWIMVASVQVQKVTSDARKLESLKISENTMTRFAACKPVAEYSDKYLYIQCRAVSGDEKYGPNDNFDAFEWEELKNSYGSFINGGVYVNHDNDDRKKAVGIILDAVPDMEDEYVEILMAINREKADRDFPGMCDGLESGEIDEVSMGAKVGTSVCAVCGNVAREPDQFCQHVKWPTEGGLRGTKVRWNGKEVLAYERNRDVEFFETSIITPDEDAADRDAKITHVIASKKED